MCRRPGNSRVSRVKKQQRRPRVRNASGRNSFEYARTADLRHYSAIVSEQGIAPGGRLFARLEKRLRHRCGARRGKESVMKRILRGLLGTALLVLASAAVAEFHT